MPSASTIGGTRSCFGDQATSRRRSASSYGFGSSTRENQAKVFVSAEHARTAFTGSSPGPATYTRRASVGKQEESNSRSAPQWAFGTAERFMASSKEVAPGPGAYDRQNSVGTQASSKNSSAAIYGFGSATRDHVKTVYVSEEHNKALYGVQSPGPMNYNLVSAVGKQVHSRTHDQPTWVFGSAQRFQYDHVKRAAGAPGPGAYVATASVGPQASSTKPSTPRFGFGTSNRQHQEKVYISAEHDKTSAGKASPGPGQYAVHSCTGSKQSVSNMQSSQSWGFGTAQRFNKFTKSSSPGPGAYVV